MLALQPARQETDYVDGVPHRLDVVRAGEVSELVDERDLGSRAERRGGSSPPFPTRRPGPGGPVGIKEG